MYINYTQSSYDPTFTDGEWAGRSVDDAIAEARHLRRLPDGLTLHAVQYDGPDGPLWATLNNRTLAVARAANIWVDLVDMGGSGMNKYWKLLRDSGLMGPVVNAVKRCK